jgi:hypothetical protein
MVPASGRMGCGRLTPTLELRRSTRGEKEGRNRLTARRVTAAARRRLRPLPDVCRRQNGTDEPGTPCNRSAFPARADTTAASRLAVTSGPAFLRAPCRTPPLERRSEAALRPGRYCADTIASLPLEQGSPWIVRFLRMIHDARETSERGEKLGLMHREPLAPTNRPSPGLSRALPLALEKSRER